jgi:hypothetical protein
MSEAFPAAVGRVDYGKYIDELEAEIKRIIADVGPGKNPEQIEVTQSRIQDLIRNQVKQLARELGLAGNHILVFMAASTILTTAWMAYALRRETSDLSKSPEDRLALTDMLNAFDLALANVIAAASNYADQAKIQPN